MARSVGHRCLAGLAIVGLLGLGACQADPSCNARNAALLAPTRAAYETMSPAQRRADSVRFNEIARRCGWEP